MEDLTGLLLDYNTAGEDGAAGKSSLDNRGRLCPYKGLLSGWSLVTVAEMY